MNKNKVFFNLINCGSEKGGMFQYALAFIEDFVKKYSHRYDYTAIIDDKRYEDFLDNKIKIILFKKVIPNKIRIKRILYVLSNFGLIPKGFGAMSYHKKIVSLNPDFLISLNQKPDNYYTNIPGIGVIHDAPRCWNSHVKKVHDYGYTIQFNSECFRILKSKIDVLVESYHAKESIKDKYNPKSKLIVLRYRPWFGKISNEKLRLDIVEKVKSNQKYVYYPSTTHPVKNHKRLILGIELYNKFYKEKLSLILTGPKDLFTEDLMKFAIKKITCIHLGYVNESEKIFIYKNSLGLAMPSLFNFGNIPVLESLALGCKILTSKEPTLIETTSNLGIYVNPLHIESIMSGLYRMLKLNYNSGDGEIFLNNISKTRMNSLDKISLN